jgi:hypothetical protein
MPFSEQAAILARSQGIDTPSLQLLADMQQQSGSSLEAPMHALQARLAELWGALRMPDVQCAPYRWAPGQPLDKEKLDHCQAEIARLESWHRVLAEQGLLDSEANAHVVGAMLAAVRDMPALITTRVAERANVPASLGEIGVGNDSEEATDAARRINDLEQKLERAERDLRRQRDTLMQEVEAMALRAKHNGDRSLGEAERRSAEKKATVSALERTLAREAARERVERSRSPKRQQTPSRSRQGSPVARRSEQMKIKRDFDALLAERGRLVSKAEEQMTALNCSRGTISSFHDKHNATLVSSEPASDEEVRSLKASVEALSKCVERFELRMDSDGLFLALRSMMTLNAWKPKELAELITTGPTALAVDGRAEDELDVAQLDHFLRSKGVLYSTNSLEYFLHTMGLSSRKVRNGARISVEKFVATLDMVQTPPLQI